jgi:hypothetical protein
MEPIAEKLLGALDDAAAAAGAEIERTLEELAERTRALAACRSELAETTAARDAKEAELERTTEEYLSLLMDRNIKAADDRRSDKIEFQLTSMRQFARGLKATSGAQCNGAKRAAGRRASARVAARSASREGN